ncbi:MAG: Tat pathway signal protein [Candidatus Bipolaricaulia bacterium]
MSLSRRHFLFGIAATSAVLIGPSTVGRAPPSSSLPERQFAWDQVLGRDAFDNAVAPKFDRLLMLDLAGSPTAEHANRLEETLRTLEREHDRGPDGLLFVIGYSEGYFRRHSTERSPVPRPRPLATYESPMLDDFDACLHLASDHEGRLNAVEAQVVDALDGVMIHRGTRTGFTGEGLPAERQKGLDGMPACCPVHQDATMFMGFKSGYRKNQATEDAVAIPDGPFAEGTTMQVSELRYQLEGWYVDMDQEDRVDRMFAPQMDQADVEALKNKAPPFVDKIGKTAHDHGRIGHLQASAQARRDGKPIMLRRDFNTTDDDHAGLHFVSLQRDIQDFIDTRIAMNASEIAMNHGSIESRAHNGIKDFFVARRRANYLIPPRSHRALPFAATNG